MFPHIFIFDASVIVIKKIKMLFFILKVPNVHFGTKVHFVLTFLTHINFFSECISGIFITN
jgi:hypothetical protein